MNIAILGIPEGWHVQQLLASARKGGHDAVAIDYRRLTATLAADRSSLDLKDVDLFDMDRILVKQVPPGSLEQVVFRMDALHRLRVAGVGVLNPPAAIEACVDKYLATAKLRDADLPIPRTWVGEGTEEALAAYEELGGDVVVKPLFGSEGRGIFRIEHSSLAYRSLRTIAAMQSVIYLQEFIHHPYDVRALVLGDRVVASMRRIAMQDFRTNVAQGGRFETWPLDAEWQRLAVQAAQAIGAPLAGVDLMPAPNGRPLVIEVNSTPGFEALSQTTEFDIPGAIVDFLAEGSWMNA